MVAIHLPPLRERRQDIGPLARHFVAKFAKDNGMTLAIEDEALEVLNRCTWPGNVRELENCIERAATQTRDGIIRTDSLSCSLNLCNSSILFQYSTLGASVGGLAPSMGPGAGSRAPAGRPGAPAPANALKTPAMTPPVPEPAGAGGAWPACASGCSAGPSPVCGAAQPVVPVPLIPLPLPEPSAPAATVPASASAAPSPAAEVPLDEPESGSLRDRLLWAMERTGWVQAKAARLLGMTTRQVSYALRKYNIEIKRF